MNQTLIMSTLKSPLSSLINLTILTFFLLVRETFCVVDPQFQACSVPKNCGDGLNIGFPFYIEHQQNPYCGFPGFNLSCNKDGHPILKLSDNDYIIHHIFYQNQSLRVSDAAFSNRNSDCYTPIQNISLPSDRFNLEPNQTDHLMFLYNCNHSLFENISEYNFGCSRDNENGSVLALLEHDKKLDYAEKRCKTRVVVPVEAHGRERYRTDEEMLESGFMLKWMASDCSGCEASGGKCGFENTTYHFKCFCPDRPHAWHCTPRKSKGLVVIAAIAASAAGFGMIILLAFYFRRKFSFDNCLFTWKKKAENCQNIEAFLRNYGSLAPKRYSYTDVKKMTHSFKDKLGQGGYGGVYKGKLIDGRLVAVKILNESKGNGEEFINEVASISRTSHVNIVALFGFCFEGCKRALIYEFVPNGSLEKFIYEKNPENADRQFKWETLYKIAVGVARGLDYLHHGCNTRILHFDIKPLNILLDEDFWPKISDFGLAKICTREESIISMSGARGTAGYIAPEVFCRNFGGVSHKSDVYSYGMMVLEMVGGRKNIDVGVDHTSEIYFPNWIYKRLELHQDLGLHGIMNEEDKDSARKMIIVSLWCIQTDPSNRPPMNRVVDMLEGSLESLQIPPQP